VTEVMHMHDSEAFAGREPTAKRVNRVKKYPIGIHARWAADGHDKLYKIGFPIWAIIEDATAKWLGGWVVPSNRTGNIVAYLWLCTVEKYGGECVTTALFVSLTTYILGIPLQFSTDCGSETTVVYGYVNAFRSVYITPFHDFLLTNQSPACIFMAILISLSFRPTIISEACIISQQSVHGFVFVLISEIMQCWYSTRVLRTIYTTRTMLNTSKIALSMIYLFELLL